MEHGPARTVAVCNQKGGVGKTTTTINLGAALAEQGRRVLLVDFDPQGALSVGLGIQPHDIDSTIYNLLMERDVAPQDVLYKTGVMGMDLLPSNIDLSGAEVDRGGRLADAALLVADGHRAGGAVLRQRLRVGKGWERPPGRAQLSCLGLCHTGCCHKH